MLTLRPRNGKDSRGAAQISEESHKPKSLRDLTVLMDRNIVLTETFYWKEITRWPMRASQSLIGSKFLTKM